MSKKEDILGTTNEDGVKFYDLDQDEKNQLQALAALMEQARLAQDLIYTRVVQNAATRLGVTDSNLEVDMAKVLQEGTENAQLKVSKVETPEEDKALNEAPTTPELPKEDDQVKSEDN